MKRIFCGLAIIAGLQVAAWARDPAPLPQFNIESSPINRETKGLTSFAPIIKKAAPSVVNIYSTRTVRTHPMLNPFYNDPFFRRFFGPGTDPHQGHSSAHKEQSLGSGVIVSSEGYILTANHVVDGADEIKVAPPDGGAEYTAKVVGADPPTDVAVLKIDARNLPGIVIADSDNLQVGDIVLAIGNPFDVGQTVTMGIVSALGRSELDINQSPVAYENFIQTDAAINPGNSGGALVDAEGRLVGINTAIFTTSRGYEGVGFAIPINLARSVMERLIRFGKVTRGYLGVSLQPEINADLTQEFHLPDASGAMVAGVLPGTPAAKAGLKSGDVIRAVDGKPIKDSPQLRLLISQLAPGTKVNLTLLRSEPGGKPGEKTVALVLGSLPPELQTESSGTGQNGDNAPNPDVLNGIEVSDLDADVRREFKIPSSVRGAVVTGVDEDSPAAAAGLQEGDVIQEINRHQVRNADDAVALSAKAKGNRVLLRVWSNGGSRFVVVESGKEP